MIKAVREEIKYGSDWIKVLGIRGEGTQTDICTVVGYRSFYEFI
jgi:hypothetical protein